MVSQAACKPHNLLQLEVVYPHPFTLYGQYSNTPPIYYVNTKEGRLGPDWGRCVGMAGKLGKLEKRERWIDEEEKGKLGRMQI